MRRVAPAFALRRVCGRNAGRLLPSFRWKTQEAGQIAYRLRRCCLRRRCFLLPPLLPHRQGRRIPNPAAGAFLHRLLRGSHHPESRNRRKVLQGLRAQMLSFQRLHHSVLSEWSFQTALRIRKLRFRCWPPCFWKLDFQPMFRLCLRKGGLPLLFQSLFECFPLTLARARPIRFLHRSAHLPKAEHRCFPERKPVRQPCFQTALPARMPSERMFGRFLP